MFSNLEVANVTTSDGIVLGSTSEKPPGAAPNKFSCSISLIPKT